MQQMYLTHRASNASSSSLLGTTAAVPQTTGPPPPPPPPVQVHHSSALFSNIPARSIHISPITLPTGNHLVGSDIRAPAPHLQPFRPAMPMSSTSLPSLMRGIPSQPASGNPPLASPSVPQLPQLPARPPLTSYQSYQQNSSSQCLENLGGLPSQGNNPTLSAMELLLDIDGRFGPSPRNGLPPLPPPPPRPDTGSNLNLDSFDASEPRALDGIHSRPGLTSDLVCLSDDE